MLKRTGGPTVTPLVLRLNFRVFSRTYMAVYGCMAVFGCIWLDMVVYGCIWLYMAISGLNISQYIGWKWIANMMTVVKVTLFDRIGSLYEGCFAKKADPLNS